MITPSELRNDAEIDPEIVRRAKTVEPYELMRQSDNEGRVLDGEYINAQEDVRKLFVESILEGTLYSQLSPEQFIRKLKEAHVKANKSGLYKKVGRGINDPDPGNFRDAEDEVISPRLTEAKTISQLSERYGDPYKDRFSSVGKYTMELDGIDTKWQPMDFFDGEMGYMYYYPLGEAIPKYMEMINGIGVEIGSSLKNQPVDTEKIIELIARQYQYGACVRPFKQVNNSIFMNLVNAQLKLAGIEGIQHLNLDFAAQRMTTETFLKYFTDVVNKKLPA